jgi:hypothetical protein
MRCRFMPSVGYPMLHGPGPPQRPHIPEAGAADFPGVRAAELTAKTLIDRTVWVDLHSGQATFNDVSSLIDFTSRSKRASQRLHVYS